jgi:hypothetical protein
MSIIGTPTDWSNLLDPLVPDILRLVLTTWEGMHSPECDAREDDITRSLCRALRQNREARNLMFQIDFQQVELDPAADQDMGRLDISFRPLIPREDIYFCLECKRLNVSYKGRIRPYTSEYVTFGVVRFVSGQYASRVRHGGMLGFILNGNTDDAVANIENHMKTRHIALGMKPPGAFGPSSIVMGDPRVKETHHHRGHDRLLFHLHHMFMERTTTGCLGVITHPSASQGVPA